MVVIGRVHNQMCNGKEVNIKWWQGGFTDNRKKTIWDSSNSELLPYCSIPSLKKPLPSSLYQDGHLLYIARISDTIHRRLPACPTLSTVMEREGDAAATYFYSCHFRSLGDRRTYRQRRPPQQRHHPRFLQLPQTHVRGLLFSYIHLSSFN